MADQYPVTEEPNKSEDTPKADTGELTPQQLKFASDALTAIKAREQEFDTGWWKQAKNAEDIYIADSNQKEFDTPYNILYSNTEVLLPSLYSATPKPDIRARFRGQDVAPIPQVLERFLTIASDPSSPGGDSFDLAMQDAVLSALVPGMGYVRIRYVEDRSFPLTYESGHYRTLLWGKATRWAKVPWIAFKLPMKRQQMFEKFDITPEAGILGYYKPDASSDSDKDDCTVYEYWDRETKKVYFLCEEWREKQLKEADDPLGMENFFPTPGLLMLTARNGKYVPIPLYNYYANQADELNRVTVRLNKVLSAIRVRGAYMGIMGPDIEKLLDAGIMENGLVAANESALLAQSGGFDKLIYFLPIEKFIQVANELYKAREAIKQVIYEITGISDIIRGSSVASETATAQDLKNKWGTVRLRRMQTLVANYTRDLFRMSVDCGSDHIPAAKWQEIVQMDIPSEKEQKLAQQQLQHMQMMAQQMQALQPPQPQGPPQPGQPPQAGPQPPGPPQMPPPDPKLLAAAKGPNMEQILTKIKGDMNRTYIVNIQTSSTIDLDTAQDKGEVTEYMNALGQLAPALAGFVQLGPSGLEAAKAILTAVSERFKFGIDLGDIFKDIQAPPPPGQNPMEAQAAQLDMQTKQAESQSKIQVAQSNVQVANAKAQAEMAKLDTEQKKQAGELQKMALELQQVELNLQMQRDSMAASRAQNDMKLRQQEESHAAKLKMQKAAPINPQT